MWNRIKKLAGMAKVKTEDMVILADGEEMKDPEKLLEFMNKFFKKKVKDLQEKLTVDREACLDYIRHENPTQIHVQDSRYRSSFKNHMKAKNTGAEGRDEISTKILKKFRHTLAVLLRHIINQAIRTGIYPEPWKVGLITPLANSGDLTNPNPAASKVLKGVLQEQLQAHMEAYEIYSPSQHAYRRKQSCESALVDLDTIVQKARNEGKVVALLMTDMSAAFNLIDKNILLSQMKLYGFTSKSRTLVHSYLTKRKTKCKIRGCTSSWS